MPDGADVPVAVVVPPVAADDARLLGAAWVVDVVVGTPNCEIAGFCALEVESPAMGFAPNKPDGAGLALCESGWVAAGAVGLLPNRPALAAGTGVELGAAADVVEAACPNKPVDGAGAAPGADKVGGFAPNIAPAEPLSPPVVVALPKSPPLVELGAAAGLAPNNPPEGVSDAGFIAVAVEGCEADAGVVELVA